MSELRIKTTATDRLTQKYLRRLERENYIAAAITIFIATSSLLWHLERIGERPPQVGSYAIVADGAGTPICIIEVTKVEIKPFNAIDAQFAFDYGEYGRTLEQWRTASWEYFSEVCARIGREPSETMPMVCQRFRRVYP